MPRISNFTELFSLVTYRRREICELKKHVVFTQRHLQSVRLLLDLHKTQHGKLAALEISYIIPSTQNICPRVSARSPLGSRKGRKRLVLQAGALPRGPAYTSGAERASSNKFSMPFLQPREIRFC